MKQVLRMLFSPILKIFESGDEPYIAVASHRWILLCLSIMFCGLAALILFINDGKDPGYYFPGIIFGGTGLLGLVIGFLGSDRAVAKLWGSR